MMKLKRLSALVTTLALALTLVTPALAAPADRFTDIATHWAREDILDMANRGYAKGYDDGTYKPEGKMTAAETLLFCARATGVASNVQEQIAAARAKEMEETLPQGMASWAAKEMAVAVEAGVLSMAELEALSQAGALVKTITRENLCMYLVRAMQLEPLANSLSTYSLPYTDADNISDALRPYVFVLTNFEVVKGTDTGAFDPKGAVTRAQMTTMLRRALAFMAENGIVTELSEYTSYNWRAGSVVAVTAAADGSTIISLNSEVSGAQSYSLPATVKIYRDNMLSTSTVLKAGQYVRLNLANNGSVTEARISGTLTTYTGSVSSLADGQLSLLVGSQTRNLTIDRFTEVMVGKTAGDRSIIDYDAGYTSAVCYVDEMGHLAAVKFSGGTQLSEGLVESVTTVGSTATLGVVGFNGVVYRYSVPTGTIVTVDGLLGSLNTGNVGDYVQVRVGTDTGAAASIAVDTKSQFIQGPVKRLGTVGTARSIYITDLFTGQELSYTVSQSAAITYNGEAKTLAQLEAGWYATVLVSGNIITRIDAYSGSVTVEGTLTSINYGTTTTLEITQKDDSVVRYDLDITKLPVINRGDRTSSIDQLRTGDTLIVTIRYNKVERIDATAQVANLTGTITEKTETANAVIITVQHTDGTTATYTLTGGVSVTQNGTASNMYNLRVGHTVALVTNGSDVISIDITATASSATQLTGTVLMTNSAGNARTITVNVVDTLGKTSLVTLDVRNASLMSVNGGSLSLSSGFAAGDQIIAYGAYDGALFVATIVIKQ